MAESTLMSLQIGDRLLTLQRPMRVQVLQTSRSSFRGREIRRRTISIVASSSEPGRIRLKPSSSEPVPVASNKQVVVPPPTTTGAADQKAMDQQRAAMRQWWLDELAKKKEIEKGPSSSICAVDQSELDKQRAAMRDWWLRQLAQKAAAAPPSPAPAAVDQSELDKQRAAMREWWLRQLAQKAAAAPPSPAPAAVDQSELDKQRAAMREWWLAQLAAKKEMPPPATPAPPPPAPIAVDQSELDKQRAAMRQWWLAKLAKAKALEQLAGGSGAEGQSMAAQAQKSAIERAEKEVRAAQLAVASAESAALLAAESAASVSERPPQRQAAMAESVTEKSETASESAPATAAAASRPKTPVPPSSPLAPSDARVAASRAMEQETIEKELERELSKRDKWLVEEKQRQQRGFDNKRKEMRDWWVARREASKRALGLEPYEPCWVLSPSSPGSIITSNVVLTGSGVVIGAMPTPIYDEKTVVVDVDTVSSQHAKIFGKDVVAGFNRFRREYFVRDLGSTNGTFLNKKKLRPNTDVKLQPGDVISLANEAKASLRIDKGTRQ